MEGKERESEMGRELKIREWDLVYGREDRDGKWDLIDNQKLCNACSASQGCKAITMPIWNKLNN